MPSRSENRSKRLDKTPLAPLPGAVCVQYIRCGKAACRCARGERHGPYYCRVWRARGRLRCVYVRLRDVTRVRAACALWRDEQRQYRRALASSRLGFRELVAMLREVEGWER
jgi:hypothetical protein